MTRTMELPRAVRAFDDIAPIFDDRFGGWHSVTAQRRAVRRELLRAFPPGSQLLELGGGTGEDALFLADAQRHVLLTDGSPAMIARAQSKIEGAGVTDRVQTRLLLVEELAGFVEERRLRGEAQFDGAFSNFAVFNCVADLRAAACALARLVRPRGRVILVVFGAFSLGEIVLHLARGDVRTAFRRMQRGSVPARISGREFVVHYPNAKELASNFAPEFRLVRKRGVGVLVPPSAAEPGISKFPKVVRFLETVDRLLAAPCWFLGDHVLIELERCP